MFCCDDFDPIFELVRFLLADILDPGPVMAERRIVHCPVEHVIVDPVEFERKEQKVRARRGDLLLDIAIEFRADRVAGIAGMEEAGIGDDAAQKFS